MKINFRRFILNLIGLTIFACITIFTIIIARGNRIDIGTGEIIETGSIQLITQPEEVRVFLNGKQVTLREKRIEALDPGDYTLKIEQDNYSSWQGKIEVKPGFINTVGITLFPTIQQLNQLTQSNIDKITYFYILT